MPELVHLSADAPTATMAEVLDRDGALILDRVLTPEAVAGMVAELSPYVAATPAGRDGFTGVRTTRTGALVARSPAVRDAVTDPRIARMCEHLMKANCERWQLHLTQLIRIMPGQGAQPIHRDRWAWGAHLKGIEPQLNTIWALTDFTVENGATQVVPGSSAWPDDRRAEAHEITQAVMQAGSVLVYTGSVFHGGGANQSDQDRWGLNLTYALGWLRQEENQYLACPPEIARTLSPELQDLLGYALGGYALGYYTPPLPPGEGPELVPPSFALRGEAEGAVFGSAQDLAAIGAQVRGG
ncbi:MAG: phytanoyl-CoA dioxygenase family protein [Phenylobacterium sp.]|uniref:phytanoyl-CoA dioxygenase family protein n=1 Tax=Phenylobacterium sp. TaxID=1871053 RepID=UPI002735E84D|nr:phytanoyl-CoA dioxygenase family protein [Phenylobacterium sp.]MDP1642824.1 phytanoyl-CoA dioxygenase family protein [Phenylobacterium sp.]MDP3116405.1 phytanoyl-CoA dioxygenase family protein [Phenylobacterium sp.]